ncbi:histidine kinase [Croceibacterium mercuriale]|uniref:histidine kinase n=1 Tax=Croceibacterium mercuriale TaxID=1572751 RepID=A0A0B2BUR3_9SPHN|nr:histidine kinase [Croceibacterium mercuriale]
MIGSLFLTLGLVQLAGSLMFYGIIDRQTLRDDHARRVAELLVVSDRLHAIAPEQTARSMTTSHLVARIASAPRVTRAPHDEMLRDIAARIIAWEPSLADRSLHLRLVRTSRNSTDLIGSLQLADGTWLNFRSHDISTMWPVAWRANVLTFVLAVAILGAGLALLNRLGAPLRRLADAAGAIGHGREVTIDEGHGPRDLRDLAHAMNVMQERIAQLLQDQARSFEAISHDLRTPLARQKIAATFVEDAEIAGIITGSATEMDDLLTSLQTYLRAQHLTASPERIELAEFLRESLAGFGEQVTIAPCPAAWVVTYPEPLGLAVHALVENAARHGGAAAITIGRTGDGWVITITDLGPGIPQAEFEAILQPFYRLDVARQRNTKGFGLGIPTAHHLMMRFNGALTFESPPGGGLVARLQVPLAEG